MPALTTREAARARLKSIFESALDRLIPPDPGDGLQGNLFIDFEDRVAEHFQPLLAVAVEERAKLDPFAQVDAARAGRCPQCGSEKVYWRQEQRQEEVLCAHGPVVLTLQYCRCRACELTFAIQARDWQLPSEAQLTPKALRRVAREATMQSFDKAAEAINEDWQLTLDGKQLQRWAGRVGLRLAQERDREQAVYESGRLVKEHHRQPVLLVVEVDGGRVQTCEIDPQTGSRWREDKVAAITTYVPGSETERPRALVTTHVATMQPTEPFGRLVRVEAEKRGLRDAVQTILIGDGGNWLDPLFEREFPNCPRLIDWYHAVEHLYDCARAVYGPETPQTGAWAEQLKTLLWEGRCEQVCAALRQKLQALAAQKESERRTLENNLDYFTRHQPHMNYPYYRRKGWPIGSGGVEGAVKQFNKRVKGTEQFWQENGAEAILALRALRLSEDGRWQRYWDRRPAYAQN